jgi:DNA-binding HxlR family transcriptional regulator
LPTEWVGSRLCIVKGYEQFCPMARASEVVTERWTPIIVRNLLAGCTTFGEILDAAPGLSKTLLVERLRKLERYKIVELRDKPSGRGSTYHLTPLGFELWPVLEALGTWGSRWLDLEEEHLNPYLVLWDLSKLIDAKDLPDRRVVIRFDLTDLTRRNRFWLLLEPTSREVCDKHPGFEEDLIFTTATRPLALWHLGRVAIGEAIRDGLIRLDGSAAVQKEFVTKWQGLSMFAHVNPELQSP